MIGSIKQRPVAALGIAMCLFIAGVDMSELLLQGPGFEELHTPLGHLMVYLAGLWTEPVSPISAGSDRRAMAVCLIQYAYLAHFVLFALLMWLRDDRSKGHLPARSAVLFASQLGLGLVGDSALSYVFAAEVAMLLPGRAGVRWMGALSVLNFMDLIYFQALPAAARHDRQFHAAVVVVAAQMLTYWIVFGVMHGAMRERRRRVELAAANAELRATQMLLGDMVRASERMRIARDLHDIIGHHLTALNLHLDLAIRQPEGQARGALSTAQELARGLLAEVRLVVSAERQERSLHLRRALQMLCDGIPAPRVVLHCPQQLEIASPLVAHTVFCCVQEALSNAVRHAGAREVSVTVSDADGRLSVRIDDDGRSTHDAPEGNGLRGMRERLAALGGELAAGARAPRGFGVAFSLPFDASAP